MVGKFRKEWRKDVNELSVRVRSEFDDGGEGFMVRRWVRDGGGVRRGV